MGGELAGLSDRPRHQLGLLRWVFQGKVEAVQCCGEAPVPVIKVDVTLVTLESALPGLVLLVLLNWAVLYIGFLIC